MVRDPTNIKILLGSQFDGQQLTGILALGAELEQVESASPAPEALLVVERPAGRFKDDEEGNELTRCSRKGFSANC